MIRSLATLVVCLGLSFAAGCSTEPTVEASPEPATTSASPARVTINVTDLRSREGQLIFSIFRTQDGFPSEESKAVNWQVRKLDEGEVTFTADLPPGDYGASVLHDENANNRMDTNLIGIPNEGYGVTNNPKPKFRAATFKESTFSLPPDGVELTISMQYF